MPRLAFPRASLRLRGALVLLVVVALVPLLVFATIVVGLYLRSERLAAERGFRDTARALSLAVDGELRSSITALEALASSRSLADPSDLDLEAFYDEAMRVLAVRNGWASWSLTDAEGRPILNSRRPAGSPLPPVADRESLDAVVRTRRAAVGAFVRSSITGEAVVAVRVPVLRDGRLLYVLSAALKPELLSGLLGSQRVPEDWTAAILDGRQTIIGRSRASERFVGQPATPKLAAAVRENPDGVFWDVTKEGRPAFGAFSRSALSEWTVVLGVPTSMAPGAAGRPLLWLAGGGAVLLAVGIVLATSIGRGLERSIGTLAAGMRAVGHGEEPGPDPGSHIRELRALRADIEHAAATLRRRDTERAEAEAALRAETEALERLNQVSRVLSVELDHKEVVQAVTDAATELTGAAFGAFFYNVVDARGETYMLYTLSGAPAEAFASFPVPRATALFGPTFRGDGIVRLDDVTADPRYGKSAPHFGMPPGHLAVRSYLAVPVIGRTGEVLGGLFLGHPEPGVFGARAERLGAGIAAHAAIAIDNARLYEEQGRARTAAEAANRNKDEFLAVLSHELRTPLNAILGWVRLVRAGRMDEGAQARALEVVERNARAQAELIEDLLDVSRMITGKLRLALQPVDLGPVVEGAVDAMRPAAAAKAVSLHVDAGGPPVTIDGDPGRLSQIVSNLVSNAVKFTPGGGRVAVRLERKPGAVELVVRDTGQGIAPELLPHIFDRFRQADSSSTRAHGGLGIGLALVKHLTDAHGGTVHAHSEGPGRGATFTVSLPLPVGGAVRERTAAPAGRTEPGTPETTLRGVRVLVVDDAADSLDLFGAILRGAGADVLVASSVPEAFGLLREHEVDVVVSDIAMPEEDGYAFVRRLRTTVPRRIPAIAATAYGSPHDRAQALAEGFDAHLAKPVEASALVAVIRRALAASGADGGS